MLFTSFLHKKEKKQNAWDWRRPMRWEAVEAEVRGGLVVYFVLFVYFILFA